jgi:hypothetical protein
LFVVVGSWDSFLWQFIVNLGSILLLLLLLRVVCSMDEA